MRAFITGVGGQDGSFLAEFLLEKGYEVYGLVRPGGFHQKRNLKKVLDNPDFHLILGDIMDPYVTNDIASRDLDEIYHLAAAGHVGKSFDAPTTTFQINTISTLNLLEALRKNNCKARLFFAGSGDCLAGEGKARVGESYPRKAYSPYGVSKLAALEMCEVYRKAYGMFISCGLLFPHESSRRDPDFFTRKVCLGLKHPPVRLGNLDAIKDWHHAKDTVRGEWLSLQQSDPGTYIFASGVGRSLREFIQLACDYQGIKLNGNILESGIAPRPLDIPHLVGDPKLAKLALGWEPQISFEEIIQDLSKETP